MVDVANNVTVTWPSVTGRSYQLNWSFDLETWTADSTQLGTGGLQSAILDKASVDALDGILNNMQQLFIHVEVMSPSP